MRGNSSRSLDLSRVELPNYKTEAVGYSLVKILFVYASAKATLINCAILPVMTILSQRQRQRGIFIGLTFNNQSNSLSVSACLIKMSSFSKTLFHMPS